MADATLRVDPGLFKPELMFYRTKKRKFVKKQTATSSYCVSDVMKQSNLRRVVVLGELEPRLTVVPPQA